MYVYVCIQVSIFVYMYVYMCIQMYGSGDTMANTIPQSMHGFMGACYLLGVCYSHGNAGSSSSLFYINAWAMIWSVD
jgi:hypothetical protein